MKTLVRVCLKDKRLSRKVQSEKAGLKSVATPTWMNPSLHASIQPCTLALPFVTFPWALGCLSSTPAFSFLSSQCFVFQSKVPALVRGPPSSTEMDSDNFDRSETHSPASWAVSGLMRLCPHMCSISHVKQAFCKPKKSQSCTQRYPEC